MEWSTNLLFCSIPLPTDYENERGNKREVSITCVVFATTALGMGVEDLL